MPAELLSGVAPPIVPLGSGPGKSTSGDKGRSVCPRGVGVPVSPGTEVGAIGRLPRLISPKASSKGGSLGCAWGFSPVRSGAKRPGQDPARKVEAGNVGQHYFRWRYDTDIPDEPPLAQNVRDPVGPTPYMLVASDLGGQAAIAFGNQSPYALEVTIGRPIRQVLTLGRCPDCMVYPFDSGPVRVARISNGRG